MFELDLAGHRREDGVIVTETSAGAGQERHAALADDDRPGGDELSITDLHAQTLANAVAAVLDAAAGFLVSHRFLLVFLSGGGAIGGTPLGLVDGGLRRC